MLQIGHSDQDMLDKPSGFAAGIVSRPHLTNWLISAFLVSLAVLAYLPIINDFPVADDFGHIAKISDLRFYDIWGFFTMQSKYYIRPIPFYSIWLLDQIFGTYWLPSHLLNVVMHGLIGVVLYKLFDEIGISKITSILAASTFVLTPLAPEAVSWTAGRFDVWALLFILLTMLFYVIFMKRGSRAAYAGSIAAATVALLSKESAMIIILIIPASELLFRAIFSGKLQNGKVDFGSVVHGTLIRVIPFFMIFSVYLAIRYIVLGTLFRSPSYLQLSGLPNFRAPLRTIMTLTSPLDQLEASESTITMLFLYIGFLYAVSLILVLVRWKKASLAARRLWLFMVVFFLATIIPVYSSFFVMGMSSYLNNSRFFYITNVAFVSLMVIGLLEFGWRTGVYRAASIIALMLVLSAYYWGLNSNNEVWEHASSISYNIVDETQRLVPNPPPDADLYFANVPKSIGAHIFASALEYSIPLNYGRQDLNVHYVNPDPDLAEHIRNSGPVPADAYLFVFDWETEKLTLEQVPSALQP